MDNNAVSRENRLRVTTGQAGAPAVQTPPGKTAFSKILRREDSPSSGGGGSQAGYGRQAAGDPLTRPQAMPPRTSPAGVSTRQDRMAGFISQHNMVPPQSGQMHGAAMLKGQDMVPLGRATAGPSASQPTGTETKYEVKAGDNLWKIARDNNMDWREIAKYNNISNPQLIQVGQQILIPTGGAGASAPGASPAAGATAASAPRPVMGPRPATAPAAAGVSEARATAKFNVSPGAGPVPFSAAPKAPAPAARPAGPAAPASRPFGPAPQSVGAPQAAAPAGPASAPIGVRGPAAPQAAARTAPMGPPAPAARPVTAPAAGVNATPPTGNDQLKAFGLDNAKVDQIINRTSRYEGDYSSLNKNTDKAGLSFGFIQFAQKPGSLGQVLTSMSKQNPTKFKQIFGPEADQMLKTVTQAPDHGLDAAGRATNPKFDLTKEPWVGRFEAAGKDKEFQGVQRSVARKSYFNPMLETAQKYDIKSPEGLSMLFDTSVQQGRNGMERILKQAAKHRTPGMSERQFLEVVAHTAAKAAGPRWQHNVLNRRMGILNDEAIANLGTGTAGGKA